MNQLLHQLNFLERTLSDIYEESANYDNQLEDLFVEVKRVANIQGVLEDKSAKIDQEIENIKVNILEKILCEYQMDKTSLNMTEKDRLIKMVKTDDRAKIKEVLLKKSHGIDFGQLNEIK